MQDKKSILVQTRKNTLTKKKAELLSIGSIYLFPDIDIEFISKSVAGPSAGKDAIHLALRDKEIETMVRLKITKNRKSIFHLIKIGMDYVIFKNGTIYHRHIKVIPKIVHSPTHAFITIDSNCDYHCAFCNSSQLQTQSKTIEEITTLIKKAYDRGVNSVALTCGVIKNPSKTNSDLIDIIKQIKIKFPRLIIGVETYIENKNDLLMLKKAGVSEIKLNIQSYDRDIFKKVCPDLSYQNILDRLIDAVKIFGKLKVCSNIIIGLGESDGNVIHGIDFLARIGVIPTIRPLSIDDENERFLKKCLGYNPIRPKPERLIYLAKEQKRILLKHKLTTKKFKTMCHACRCCDIVPFIDV